MPALLLGVAIFTLWPSWRELGSVIPGDPTSDAYDHLWGYWWWAHALRNLQNPLVDTLSHQPPGGALWFVDPLNALLAAPLQAVMSTATATTVVLTGQVWLTLIAGWLGLRRDSPLGAPAAAILIGAGAYVVGLLQSGVYEFVAIGPVAAFYYAVRSGVRPSVCALLWFLAALANFYYAAFAGLLAVVVLAEGRTTARRLLTIGIIALPAIAALAALAYTTLSADDAVVRPETAPSWSQGNFPAVDPASFLRWGSWYFPENARMGNFGIVHVAYVGWAAITFALVGIAGRGWPRRLVTLALAIGVASGPALAWNQQPVRVSGHDVWLPMALLYFPGSPMKFVHHPYRLVVVLLIAMSPLVARGVQMVTSRLPGPLAAPLAVTIGLLFVVETHTISPAHAAVTDSRRSPTAPVDPDPFTLAAASDPLVTGIFNFPPDAHRLNRRYEMLAIFHHKQIPYGVNSFLPDGWQRNGFVLALLACLDQPQRYGIGRDGGPPPRAWFDRTGLKAPAPPPAEIAAGERDLRAQGYSHVVLTGAFGQNACLRRVEETYSGREGEPGVWELRVPEQGRRRRGR